MNFDAYFHRARTLAVVAVAVTLPWRTSVWNAAVPVELAPPSMTAAHAAPPTEARVARSARERQTAPRHRGSATTPPARVEIPAAVGDTIHLTLDRDAHADPAPAVDEAIAQLLAWVAADQTLRAHDLSGGHTPASALVASAGPRR
jgi:hypothetical protein